jgi:phosphatidylserine/phosphatidylglycerophosphate/cardiolipin synthase-like enzyme
MVMEVMMAMDEDLAIERITENENLTDGLEDDDANWLLHWGTSRVGGLIAGIDDDEMAGEKVNQLMAVMRSFNAIAADRSTKTPAALGDDIRALRDQYRATFGGISPANEHAITRLSNTMSSMTARAAMQQLLAFLEAPETLPEAQKPKAIPPVMFPEKALPTAPTQLPPQPAEPPAPQNGVSPAKSPLDSIRQRITSFLRCNRRLTTILLGVISGITLIAIVTAVLVGLAQRRTPPGTTTTPDITVYFTSPSSQTTSGIDQHVVAALNQAKKTIDVASFDFNLPSVTNALERAQGRGIVVRVVVDEENGVQVLRASDAPGKKEFNALRALGAAHIPVVDGGRSNGLMHDKFILIDGSILFVGSWNMSYNDTFRNNNNLVRITNEMIAANYQAKFNEMFVAHRFGAKSTVGALVPRMTIDGVAVENYFSPHDAVMSKIAALVRGAKTSIHFLAFTYTSADLAAAMVAQKKAGIRVQGVIESRGASQGALPALFCNGIAVQTDGNSYTMHDKVIILDGQTVITGSFNFTQSADRYNDENVIILHNRALGALYEQEFNRIVVAAKQPSNVNCAATPTV